MADFGRQTRRGFLAAAGAAAWALSPTLGRKALAAGAPGRPARDRPNFVLIYADDLGYGDLGCYGAEKIRTPRLDTMAREGMRLTSFYAQTVCGPSRAALMTGCYPLRVATQANRVEIHPHLHDKEITVAEVLKAAGYATGAFGKWDLAGHSQQGFTPELMPNSQGFDYFFGTPTSNDSVVNLYRNDTLVEKAADMSTLTGRYTDEAIAFMKANKERPFFVYIPHTMPHTRLAASERFRGRSPRGLYGDVVEEIDWNTGRILDAVQEMGLDDRTYVIFTSDNGPWALRGDHGGSAGPLRGAKTSTWEGGLRVPCIVRAPGRVPKNTVCDEVTATLDVLPTLAALAGARVPKDRIIDGRDLSDLIQGKRKGFDDSRPFFYYQHTHLSAVRCGKWKLHLPHRRPPLWAEHVRPNDAKTISRPMLFDLDSDIGEQTDVSAENPNVVRRLLALAEKARQDIGDYDRIGAEARFFDPQPRRPDIAAQQANPKNPPK
jgi:arylsulfatase A-like enzyme